MSKNGVPQINLLQFHRADLLPIYRKMAGHEETYPEVAEDFDTFLVEHAYERFLYDPSSVNAVRARFEEFLQRGFYHPSSPAGLVQKIIREIKNTANPFTAYLAWQDFVNQYILWLKKLVSELYELRSEDVVLDPSYIEKLIENSEAEFAAKKMDAEVEKIFDSLPNILKIFLGSQRGLMKSTRSGVLYLKYAERDSLSGQINALGNYDRIFEWIRSVFMNLEGLEKIYIKPDERFQDVRVYTRSEDIPYKILPNPDYGLKVILERKIPHGRPPDPDLIRHTIDVLFFVCALSGTRKKPVQLRVSWDSRKKSMIVSTNSLGEITKREEWPHAELLITRLNGVVNITEGIVQIPFGEKKGGAKSDPSIEDASSGHPSTNSAPQSGAAPALQAPLIIAPANQMILGASMTVMPVNVSLAPTQLLV